MSVVFVESSCKFSSGSADSSDLLSYSINVRNKNLVNKTLGLERKYIPNLLTINIYYSLVEALSLPSDIESSILFLFKPEVSTSVESSFSEFVFDNTSTDSDSFSSSDDDNSAVSDSFSSRFFTTAVTVSFLPPLALVFFFTSITIASFFSTTFFNGFTFVLVSLGVSVFLALVFGFALAINLNGSDSGSIISSVSSALRVFVDLIDLVSFTCSRLTDKGLTTFI
ncbi:hypothetical protein V1478_006829 [Vespula squamosa]|uniref:Uncharacterized protein n=1 Tax=Vespula squamosa TaxID=30214 RepID=A0ABD2B112_VESSQ